MRRKLATLQNFEKRVAEHLRKLLFVVVAHGGAQAQGNTGHLSDLQGRIFEPVDLAVFVHGHQARTDFQRAGVDDLPLLDDRYLASSAADVDVHDGKVAALMIGHMDCARTIGRKNRLEVVTRAGTDEFSRFRGKQGGNGFGVFLFRRLAGHDHRPGIDVVRGQTGLPIRLMNEFAQLVRVDSRFVHVRGEQDRRFVNNLPIDDHKAAGKRDALTPQGQARKNQM